MYYGGFTALLEVARSCDRGPLVPVVFLRAETSDPDLTDRGVFPIRNASTQM